VTFQKNISLPSAGLKNKLSKKPATSSETSFDFEQCYIPQILTATSVTVSNPTKNGQNRLTVKLYLQFCFVKRHISVISNYVLQNM
jgi:hypothetical protein